jgi:hypothetical protein
LGCETNDSQNQKKKKKENLKRMKKKARKRKALMTTVQRERKGLYLEWKLLVIEVEEEMEGCINDIQLLL